MGDEAPNILFSVDRAGQPVAVIERKLELSEQGEILDRYPVLLDRSHALELARLVNHFAREFKYEVIADPAAFEAAYRAQIEAEAPGATFDQSSPRLRDFGLPDFAAIKPPSFDGRKLVFFARSTRLGVPYRVDVTLEGSAVGAATYEPVAMGVIP